MNTVWILVFLIGPRSPLSTSFTIENLVSADECKRVANVLSEWRYNQQTTYKCIEVIKK